jgi:hypothetical protein
MDEASDPIQVGLIGAQTAVFDADAVADVTEKLPGPNDPFNVGL